MKFKDFINTATFSKSVDSLASFGEFDRMDIPLLLAQNYMFNFANGARRHYPNVLIMVTGNSFTYNEQAEDPRVVGAKLREDGIHLIFVTVGKGAENVELDEVAGKVNTVHRESSMRDVLNRDLGRIGHSACSFGKEILLLINIIPDRYI